MAIFNSKLFVYQRVDVDTYYHITILVSVEWLVAWPGHILCDHL